MVCCLRLSWISGYPLIISPGFLMDFSAAPIAFPDPMDYLTNSPRFIERSIYWAGKLLHCSSDGS